MTDRSFSLLSLPVVACLLAVLTLGLVLVGRSYGLGTTTFALLAIPVVLALAYLAWYRTLPYQRPRPRPRAVPPPEDDEPFEDPVEEADRMEAGSDDLESDGEPAEPPEDAGEEPAAPPVRPR